MDQSGGDHALNEKSSYATKKFCLEGISLYSDEFISAEKPFWRSCSSSSDTPTLETKLEDSSDQKNMPKGNKNLVLCGKLSGRHEVAVRFKQCDTISGPKVCSFYAGLYSYSGYF